MVHHIKKCPKCGIYTLKEICPNCKIPTISPKPPKYSPFSRLAQYRREALREERERDGLI